MDFTPILNWFQKNGWQPFSFQLETWTAYAHGKNGLLNAPTGSGKTYAVWLACLLQFQHETANKIPGLKYIWITPLRALTADIKKAMEEAAVAMGIPIEIDIRTGDVSQKQKDQQKKKMPDALVTTPESIHILFSHKNHERYFKNVKAIIIDEWHELLHTKRGTQTELLLAHIKSISHYNPQVWGVTATIGNMDQALKALVHDDQRESELIIGEVQKAIAIKSIIPENIENMPWAGHIGLTLLPQIIPIIESSSTTLLFTNTRSQTEIWYHNLLNKAPQFAGVMAMHHGSIDSNIRRWVEDALKEGKLKVVICTSSLDLGVDFSPVETIIQVGGPKGVSRFMQRAGRSGHQPGSLSKIYFVPTHTLELIEGAALREASKRNIHEDRVPLELSIDVLIQFLVTLACGSGFDPDKTFKEVKRTYAFRNLSQEQWDWTMHFITYGGSSLDSYDEYKKVEWVDGLCKTTKRRISTRHRLSIGTIVSDPMLKVRFVTGGYIGTVEESFLGKLNPGDRFWFSGRNLEFVRIKEMTAYVRKSNRKSGLVPQWMGGRLPLSSKLANLIRSKLNEYQEGNMLDVELQALDPIFKKQQQWSRLPSPDIFLIEYTESKEGHHLFFYPFEGRFVHEVLSAIVAYRIARLLPISFSLAMNDYGFELLSDQEIPIEDALEEDLFTEDNLLDDLKHAINNSELAKRKFRDVAAIAGLVFKGYPGKIISSKHLQASSQLIYDVMEEYDKDNLLTKQAKDEVLSLQIDLDRLQDALRKINMQEIKLARTPRFTPFSFPIMADRLREKLSSEKLSDRLVRLQLQSEKMSS